MIMVVLVLALAYFSVDKFVFHPQREAAVREQVSAQVEEARQEGRSEALVESYGDRSIAVLPFENMSEDAANEYFSDGITEEILNLLAKIPELRVISRSSAFAYKDKETHIPDVAKKLNVGHVLEGSVRKSGTQIRITVQLIDANSDTHLWSETYDRQLTDVFAVQDEISTAVVEALKMTLIGEVPTAHSVDPEAYTFYLRGKSIAEIHSEENLQQAAALIQKALEIEPEFAEAWAALATIRGNQVGRYYLPRAEGFAQAQFASERALEIDPKNANARSSLCWIRMYHERDLPATRNCVLAALEFSPNNVSVLNTVATFYGHVDRLDLSIAASRKAQETDPLSASVIFNLAFSYLEAEQIDNAVAQLEVGRSLYPDAPFVAVLDSALALRRGTPEEAHTLAENMPGPMGSWLRAMAFVDLDRPADVEIELQKLESSDALDAPYIAAAVHGYRGDADAAFEWLERALETGDNNLIEMRNKFWWEKIKADPRWQPFLARIGLSDADIAALGNLTTR